MMILVIGGAASGKSAVAEKIASACGGKTAYLATLQAEDDESRARVARHRKLRAGRGFFTLECPLRLPDERELAGFRTGLLECVTTLTANVMFSLHQSPEQTARAVAADISRLRGLLPCFVAVTGHVFADGVRYEESTRGYLQALGEINRASAEISDIVVESVCGIPVPLRGKEAWSAFADLF